MVATCMMSLNIYSDQTDLRKIKKLQNSKINYTIKGTIQTSNQIIQTTNINEGKEAVIKYSG